MEKLEALFSLVDQASGPAAKIAAAFRGLDQAGKALGGGGGVADMLKNVAVATGSALQSLAGFAADAISIAADVASKAAGYALAGLEAILDASEEKKRALKQLAVTEGSDAAGAAILQDLKDIANAAGQSDTAIKDLFIGLRNAGLQADTAKQAIEAMLDVKAVGSQQNADALNELLKKTAETGQFKVEGRQLKNLGIPEAVLFESLRSIDRYKNATDAQLSAALKSGQITADEGTKALLDSVNAHFDKGAGLGSAGKNILGDSFEGQLQRIKNILSDLVENIDLTPIINGLKAFADILSGPAGKAAAKELGEGVGTLMKDLASIATPENLRALVDIFGVLVGWIRNVIDWTMQMVEIVRAELNSELGQKAIGNLIDVFKRLWGYISAVPWGDIFKLLVDGILITVDAVAAVVGFILDLLEGLVEGFVWMAQENSALWTGLWNWIQSAWDSVVSWFEAIPGDVYDYGVAIVQGLWDGIKAAWGAFLKQFQDLVDLLPDAVKKVLGIASPSKVMMQLGIFAGEGFGLGVEQSMNDNAIGASLGGGPSISVGASSGGGGGAGGPPQINVTVQINMQGGGGAGGPSLNDIEKAAEEGARRGTSAALEQMAHEEGVMPTGTG